MRMVQSVYWTLLLFLLGSLWACSEDNGDPEIPSIEEPKELQSVRIHIGTIGTIQTRYGDDENALKGEFMNTLRVYIVDADGMVEKIINATDSVSAFVPEDGGVGGCETDYSTSVDLLPGVKTIYAFANMENSKIVGNDDEETTLGTLLDILEENTEWNTEIDNMVIQNPAENVDLKDNFIPMSAKHTVNLNTDGQTVNVALVRLVCKVQASITNRQGASIRISKISWGNYANRVALFEGVNVENVEYTESYMKELTGEDIITIAANDSYTFDVIYFNETLNHNAPFTIALTIDDREMKGTTSKNNISRNTVYPLTLRLADSNLQLNVVAQIAPIGGYPISIYMENPLTENYYVELPEGCSFSLEGTLVNQTSTSTPIESWTWFLPTHISDDLVPNDVTKEELALMENNVHLDGVSNGSIVSSDVVTGHLTALPEQNVLLGFEITQPSYVEGTLSIKTVALKDIDDYQAMWTTRSFRWDELPRRYEPIHVTTP